MLAVLVKFAVTVVAPVTVAVPFVQLEKLVVYPVAAVGVAVTLVPLTLHVAPLTESVVP